MSNLSVVKLFHFRFESWQFSSGGGGIQDMKDRKLGTSKFSLSG